MKFTNILLFMFLLCVCVAVVVVDHIKSKILSLASTNFYRHGTCGHPKSGSSDSGHILPCLRQGFIVLHCYFFSVVFRDRVFL